MPISTDQYNLLIRNLPLRPVYSLADLTSIIEAMKSISIIDHLTSLKAWIEKLERHVENIDLPLSCMDV
jgi:hypothetical protein